MFDELRAQRHGCLTSSSDATSGADAGDAIAGAYAGDAIAGAYAGDAVARGDAATTLIGNTQRELLGAIAQIDRTDAWKDSGARDCAHWVAMRYGISYWKALRWLHAGHVLERLPSISRALSRGELSIDQVVELCRFATPEWESKLIAWAKTVSVGAVRRRGDREIRMSVKSTREADRERTLSWWWTDEGRRLSLQAELPAGYKQLTFPIRLQDKELICSIAPETP